ncbi:MFS transporter [Inhella proteolytica]|uniref:MFS transporter n=1 Tax=Inhella proteolytica TaxID=2795029 RepID=A0A931NJ53_9BURK|nr:MFS transporter [Inhella proteolytica]MBH9578674.1 MFS transporter [Inhella proteolytica]
MHAPSARSPSSQPWALLLCAGLVLGMSMGSRHVQGLFMLPLLGERGWGREAFSFALGLQALVWGLLQPVVGWLADRFGTRRVIVLGCGLYALGLAIESWAPTPAGLSWGVGVLIGLGLTATTFSVVYGGLARRVEPSRRGWAQGIAGGIGGLIQFALVPLVQAGIGSMGWSPTLLGMAACAALTAGTAWVLDDRPQFGPEAGHQGGPAAPVPVGPVLRRALGHSGFWLLNLGFLSCGFQLAFLGTHLPAYLRDAGMSAADGVAAIALIALTNAFGVYACGRLGDLYRRKYLLAGLYGVRTAAMLVFFLLPLSAVSLWIFAIVMGATWLGTVPLTTGVLAEIFGVRYLGTLFGLVFLGHQAGGFAGAWLGGLLFDATGSYSGMWLLSIGLGLASIALHLPIRDRSIESELALQAA